MAKAIVMMKSRRLETSKYAAAVEFFYETPVIVDGIQHYVYTQFWNVPGDKHWEAWMDEDQDFSRYETPYHDEVLKATLAEYGYTVD